MLGTHAAVDAPNAPTAACKTRGRVSHSSHNASSGFLFFEARTTRTPSTDGLNYPQILRRSRLADRRRGGHELRWLDAQRGLVAQHARLGTMRQNDATKVHFDVVFSRYKADGSKAATYQSLWIVTKKDGQWGVQARSSFAP
jgi:hypothetical protein